MSVYIKEVFKLEEGVLGKQVNQERVTNLAIMILIQPGNWKVVF